MRFWAGRAAVFVVAGFQPAVEPGFQPGVRVARVSSWLAFLKDLPLLDTLKVITNAEESQ